METTYTACHSRVAQAAGERRLVSVVVPCKNRPDAVVRLLESLHRQDYPAMEIIVVDDGSEPPIPASNGALHVRLEASCGPCVARNLGLARARGEYVLLLDDDASLGSPDLVARAVMAIEQDRQIGAVAFLQLMPDGRLHYMQPTSCLSSPSPVARFFSYGCLLRMRALSEIGGFQPEFGYYYEEIEMSVRLLDAGYTILCDPALQVVHHEDGRGRNARRINRLLLRNALFTSFLRYPAWFVVPGMLVHVYRFLRTSWISGTRDWGGMFWAVLQLVESIGILSRKRRPVRFATLRLVRRLTR
jgi:GT2 family glycosyltransferase